MKTYYLCTHVYVCEVDDGAVFLDLKKDAYAGIGNSEARAVSDFISGWSETPHPAAAGGGGTAEGAQVAEALATRGLLTAEKTQGKRVARIHLERIQSIEFRGLTQDEPRIGAIHIARFLAACATAAMKLRRHSLEKVVNDVMARKKRHAGRALMETERIVALVKIFRRLTPLLYTAKDSCLFDSLALVEFLYRYRVFPVWVFGVDTRPFQAHSWVQYGALVLNDDLERARQHHPILAL